jgi:hypothetical protein
MVSSRASERLARGLARGHSKAVQLSQTRLVSKTVGRGFESLRPC